MQRQVLTGPRAIQTRRAGFRHGRQLRHKLKFRARDVGSDAPSSGGEEPLQRKLKTKGEETESRRCNVERDKEKPRRLPGERPRPTRTDLHQGRDQGLVSKRMDTARLGVVENNGGVLKSSPVARGGATLEYSRVTGVALEES